MRSIFAAAAVLCAATSAQAIEGFNICLHSVAAHSVRVCQAACNSNCAVPIGRGDVRFYQWNYPQIPVVCATWDKAGGQTGWAETSYLALPPQAFKTKGTLPDPAMTNVNPTYSDMNPDVVYSIYVSGETSFRSDLSSIPANVHGCANASTGTNRVIVVGP